MLSAKELAARLEELSNVALTGRIAGTQTVIYARDIAVHARDQKNALPYLIGVVPPADVAGRADGYYYVNHMEIFVGFRIDARGSLSDFTADMDTCAAVVRDIVRYIQSRATQDRFWGAADLGSVRVEPSVVQQMRGLDVSFNLKTQL